MPSDKHCCVPGCKSSSGGGCKLHQFPNPEKDRERFNTWISAIKNIDIHGLENKHIFRYRRVCHLHFEAKYICWNNRISNIAVPTLNLPGSITWRCSTPAGKPLCEVIDVPQRPTSTGPSLDDNKGLEADNIEVIKRSEEVEYIQYREYAGRRWLCTPSRRLVEIVSNLHDIIYEILSKNNNQLY